MVPDTLSPLQLLEIPMLPDSDAKVWIKRDDLLAPLPGNKGRKLKYHIEAMREMGTNQFYTFGGPFSNHLVAASTLCKRYGIEGTGYVRGSIGDLSNPVLNKARENGLELVAMTRIEYSSRNEEGLLKLLAARHPNAYLIPEGGAGQQGLEGCGEIADEVRTQLGHWPDQWYVPAGTCTTAVGIANRIPTDSKVLAMSALREKIIQPSFGRMARLLNENGRQALKLNCQYNFGGLAKWTDEFIRFMLEFEEQSGILLDPIYTAKAMYGLIEDITTGKWTSTANIVFVHSGGAPGRWAFDYRNPGVLS